MDRYKLVLYKNKQIIINNRFQNKAMKKKYCLNKIIILINFVKERII